MKLRLPKIPTPWAKGTQHAASPAPDGKKPSTGQLFEDNAIEDLIYNMTTLPDPDMILQSAGLSRAELRKLEYDDEISTALETRLSAIQSTPWRIEPAEGAEERAEFIHDEIDKIAEDAIVGAWQATPYGYSVMEVIYERRPDGRIGINRIEERPFEWFEPLRNGKLRYYPSNGLHHIDVDTKYKFILSRRRPTYRNPYGQAILSRLYPAFFLRQSGWEFWPQFLERFGSPLLIGKTANNTDEMAQALATALRSATAAVDKDDDVQVVSSQSNGEAFERFERTLEKRIQKVVLGQTLTTDTDGQGSYAAAKVHDDVRGDRKYSDTRIVTGALQHIVDALNELNWPGTDAPGFVLDGGEGLQTERAERDARLAQSGIVKFTEEYIVRAYDYEPGDFTIPQGWQPGPAGQQQSVPSGPTQFASSPAAGFTEGQQAVEDLADDAEVEAASPIPPAKIVAAIKASNSPDDLQERLAQIYDGNDPKAFRDLLERALFAADVMGYSHTEDQV